MKWQGSYKTLLRRRLETVLLGLLVAMGALVLVDAVILSFQKVLH